jgi:biotin/methionine sulfoxide reductase
MNICIQPDDRAFVLTGSHWGMFRARASNGRVMEIQPFEHDPNPTLMLSGLAESYDHATRVQRPAIRESWLRFGPGAAPERRGAERFVEVGWDEALDIVASELLRARKVGGNESIFGGSQGWASAGQFHHAKTQLKRFLNCFGGFTDQINGYSYGAANVVVPHLVGDLQMMRGPSTSWPSIIENTTLLLSFGGLAPKNAQVLSGGCGEHSFPRWIEGLKSQRVRVISVSPIRDDMASDLGAEWHAIVPNTDTALMLSLAHSLLEADLHDGAFLERYCVGFDKVAKYLRTGRDGAGFDAEWAAEITQLDAGWIRALAKDLARERSFIAVSWSLQRADNGEQTYWAAMTLAAMLGQIGLPGGGIGFGYGSGAGTVGSPSRRVSPPRLPGLKNPTGSYIPASRVADLLLRPGEPLEYNGNVITLPKIDLIYWCGGNPFHHHQDLNRLIKALRRPRAFVVHEIVWAPIARYADIVLPATTTFERNDISSSSKDNYLFAMKKVAPTYASALNDHDIFVQLAERLGMVDPFTERLDEFGWLRRMYEETIMSAASKEIQLPEFDEFWDLGYFRFPERTSSFISFADFRRDPDRAPLKTPSGRIELFSDKVASFGYDECPGHAVWREPREWLGSALAKRFPLHLISNQPTHRLHSQLDPVGVSKSNKLSDREPVYISPSDASKRGLRSGDVARLFNERGSCLAGVVISDALRPGVVQLSTGAWFDPVDPSQIASLDAHGSVNVLTHDHGTSRLAQGPAAHSALVEVEKYEGPLPPVKVHQAPNFTTRPSSEQ